jgi:hypothetical protein
MEAVNDFYEDQYREFLFEGLEHRWANSIGVGGDKIEKLDH